MPGLEVRNVDSPDEVRKFVDKGDAKVTSIGGATVIYGTFEPGWVWSEHLKPIAGTDTCQAPHLIYCVSGRMGVRMDDGTEGECGPGDLVSIAPGHDAWVIGDEACVCVDFGGHAQYAKA